MLEEWRIERGARSSCSTLPRLFNIYTEATMEEAMEVVDEGIIIGGSVLSDVRFEDNLRIIAQKERIANDHG